ncbi:hypothetical protein [Nocardia sp. CDC160]|uniref:hypothetical protein n=1 Tax=Nocardia sp. CDC160 TaxID=3112166 RepID=UPI002DBF2082|nr:hypothetical protein [Nocardia sp. CDC160]MEC3913622.1 hypothetical protein [Nocardia sp. CDC160]
MSENTANRGRARRRVVRQAGPPVEGDGAAVEIRESVVVHVSPERAAVDAEPTPVAEPDAEPAAADSVVDPVSANGDSVEQTEPEHAEPKSRIRKVIGSLGRVGTVAAAVALVSALVLIGSTGLFFYHQHRADTLSQRRAEYIQVAKQAYINMVTVSDSSSGPDIDRLLSVTGGGLKNDVSQNRDDIKKFFEQLKVQSSGKVIAAAIESDDADSASVLLLAQQTVSNVATNGPMQRDYRVRVHVTRSGDTVSASNLEIVP